MRHLLPILFGFLCVFVLSILGVSSSHAQTITATAVPTSSQILIVTKLADTNDGVCNSDCSLREAIAAANSDGSIEFMPNLNGLLSLNSGLTITKNLTIKASQNRSDQLTITNNNLYRMFTISLKSTFRISNLTFLGNNSQNQNGGIIWNQNGIIIIYGCVFQQNFATSGGAIQNESGVVSIDNSTFESNHATTGGAISSLGGSIFITNTTFHGNTATMGGALQNLAGKLTIKNSTFQGNLAGSGGAIFNNSGNISITSGTFHGNSQGGGESILERKSSRMS